MKDKIIENLIQTETKRQNETLDLIPSESFASQIWFFILALKVSEHFLFVKN